MRLEVSGWISYLVYVSWFMFNMFLGLWTLKKNLILCLWFMFIIFWSMVYVYRFSFLIKFGYATLPKFLFKNCICYLY